jgi:arylsulfatase
MLFDHEARQYNVYPMANNTFELIAAPRPKLVSGDTATYTPGTVRVPEDAIIDIKNRSFSLIVEVDNPDGDAEGTLVTLDGETGGFAFLNLQGRPTFLYNWIGRERYTIAASQPLPRGACTIAFDFAYDGGGRGKGGTGTLTVNGNKVGEGRIDKTVPIYVSTDDTFDVGEDWGTPVSAIYRPPFRFTGTLKTVTVTAR